jgi:hypothetical protein
MRLFSAENGGCQFGWFDLKMGAGGRIKMSFAGDGIWDIGYGEEMKIRIKKDCRLQAGGREGAGVCHKVAGALTWGGGGL